MVADLERVAAELGEPPRVVRRITMSPKAATRLREVMRVEGPGIGCIEVLSHPMIHGSAQILEYTDGTVEMLFRGKVIPLGKRCHE